MIDMVFKGPPITWTNNSVMERLDRCICSCDWRIFFLEAKVIHLARMLSNHCPLLIKLLPHGSSFRLNRPFQFHTMWMQHATYEELISNSWSTATGDIISKTHEHFLPKKMPPCHTWWYPKGSFLS